MKKLTVIVVLLITALWITPALAQSASADKPADNMQILRDKIKADKKLVVAANMNLTESEAKGFWPVYEAYQKDLEKINARAAAMIKTYATAWNTKSMDNKKAKKLTSDFVALQEAELKHVQSYIPKLNKVLPATKVARYLQIENKIRTIVKYEAAREIPLVPDE
jgi:4-amino-4-deoxy-L-arabinose transferase-like glycosyltransferase